MRRLFLFPTEGTLTDRHKRTADLINSGKPVAEAMLAAGYGEEFVKGCAATFVADVLAPLGLVKAKAAPAPMPKPEPPAPTATPGAPKAKG